MKALMSFFSEDYNILHLISLALLLLSIFGIGSIIYNLFFHPLRAFPGPKAWAGSNLLFLHSLLKGDHVLDVQKIHERYGDIVRLAPNELSFTKAEAWNDILMYRAGHQPFPKNQEFYGPPPGQVHSIITTPNHDDHARMRRLMGFAFTKKALESQEPMIQMYVELLISRLKSKVDEEDDAVLDIVPWYNFTTFDIVGDLGLGEPFGCLRDSNYHPWVLLVQTYIKATILVAAIRHYPLLESLLVRCLPKRVMTEQRQHYELVVERVHRRMNLEKKRPDIMSHVLEQNDENGMTIAEIEATLNILMVAGSETSATALSGITHFLTKSPQVLQELVSEIRTTFKNDKDITLAATRDLPYLNATIKEGLRVCNPVTKGLPRLVPKGGDTVCGYWLPGGTHVSVSSTLFTSPAHFANPTAFIPERWFEPPLQRSAEFDNDDRAGFQPFSVGPRNCIGKELALAEMRLILARMVWEFEIEGVQGRKELEWGKQKTYFVIQKEAVMVRLRGFGGR